MDEGNCPLKTVYIVVVVYNTVLVVVAGSSRTVYIVVVVVYNTVLVVVAGNSSGGSSVDCRKKCHFRQHPHQEVQESICPYTH